MNVGAQQRGKPLLNATLHFEKFCWISGDMLANISVWLPSAAPLLPTGS